MEDLVKVLLILKKLNQKCFEGSRIDEDYYQILVHNDEEADLETAIEFLNKIIKNQNFSGDPTLDDMLKEM